MQRKVFSAELKAKVALEALAGRKTVNEIAGAHEVHPHQVATWKREAQEGLKTLFERRRGRRRRLKGARGRGTLDSDKPPIFGMIQRGRGRIEEGTDREALYGQIGRLQVQVEWLKKKSGLNPPP